MKQLTNYIQESISGAARAFIVIKPGFFDYAKEIIDRFARDGWYVERQISKQLLPQEAKDLYKIHRKEEWYKELTDYMSSAVSTAFILRNDHPSHDPYKQVERIKDEFRDKYGEDEMRNVMHSSDSGKHMNAEKFIYFAY